MEETTGCIGVDEGLGEGEGGWEDSEERKDQGDGALALQQISALLRRNVIVSTG